jgi:uncharacterized RDD family membrane protein YckC
VRQDVVMTSPPAAWPHAYPPPGYAPPPVHLGGYPPASPAERQGATVLDHLVLLVPSLLVTAALVALVGGIFVVGGQSLAPEASFPVLAGSLSLWALVHAAVYYADQVTSRLRAGQTVGKGVVGLRVVRLDGGVPDRGPYRRRFLVGNAAWLA